MTKGITRIHGVSMARYEVISKVAFKAEVR